MFNEPSPFPALCKGCIEEIVIIYETNDILKYSLSNSLDNIETAIYARTGCKINLEQGLWKLNPDLSISIKHLMNFYNVNYSMTSDTISNAMNQLSPTR